LSDAGQADNGQEEDGVRGQTGKAVVLLDGTIYKSKKKESEGRLTSVSESTRVGGSQSATR